MIEDPFLYTKAPRISRILPRILPRNVPKDRDIKKIIVSIPRNRMRDRAIIELLYGSGIRAGELLSLKMEQIDFDRSMATVYDSKNKKERIVPLNDLTVYSLKNYFEKERPSLLASSPLQNRTVELREADHEIVFLKKGGFPLCKWRLSELIENYRKEEGAERSSDPS